MVGIFSHIFSIHLLNIGYEGSGCQVIILNDHKLSLREV